MSEEKKHRFVCYPSATEGNPLLGVNLHGFGLVPLPGSKYDPLVVELTTGATGSETGEEMKPYVRVYRNGILIAHSAVEYKT